MGIHETLGPLSERPFRLLWLGRTTSSLGDALIPVALAFAILGTGGSAADIGIVLAAFTAARTLFILAGGVWADRLERRRLMVGCDLVRGASQAALAALLLAGAVELWHFVVAAFVVGGADAFFGPASTGLIPEVVSRGRLQQANALVGLSDSGSWLAGPALAGVLVALSDPGVVFALDALSFFASAGFLSRIRIAARPLPARQAFLADLRHGLRVIRERSWLVAALFTFGISNLTLAAYQVLGPVVAERELGGAAEWGAIMSGGAVGGIVGGAVALRWKPSRPLLVSFPVMVLAAAQLGFLAVPLPVWGLIAGSAGSVFAIVFGNAIWDTVMQGHVPQDALSRVSSVDWAISLVLMPLGYVLAGPLADAVGIEATLLGAAGLALAANLGVTLVPSVRRLRYVDVPAEEASPASVAAAAAPGSAV